MSALRGREDGRRVKAALREDPISLCTWFQFPSYRLSGTGTEGQFMCVVTGARASAAPVG